MQTHSGKSHSWCQPQPQCRRLISPAPQHTSATQQIRLGYCTRSEQISHCFDLHFFECDSLRLLNDFLSVASLHPLIVPGHSLLVTYNFCYLFIKAFYSFRKFLSLSYVFKYFSRVGLVSWLCL